MGRIEGKVAMVTGAGSGLGRAIALRFAAEGAKVIAADITDEEVKVAADATGGQVVPLHCDVSKPEEAEGALESCRAQFGRLDILINNAGNFPTPKPLHETTFAEWDRVIAVHLRGSFALLKFGLPLMIKSGGGAVVNMASLGSFRAVPGLCPYTAAKGALIMLTKQAALEYAQDNIRVNAICPGPIMTPAMAAAPPEALEASAARVPMARLGTPEEIANLALFLASDEASFITGAYFMADGGVRAGSGRPPRIERKLD